MLYNLIILPIELIVDWVFSFFYNTFSHYGVITAIFGVSFTINLLALPLYNVADALQEKERLIARSLEDRVKRIKEAFKGDEQFMMLSTYYRQNNYHPLYVLRSSLSILIEIPFFIAAYHFLSHCPALSGAKFWIFSDLGKPDGFFHIGAFQVNVLPILMTAINFVSGAVYTKEAPAREKIQLYAVAMIFLVLLYYSPSGLVLYWILNNIFSLIKNIVKKQENPLKIFHILMSIVVCALGLVFCIKTHSFAKRGMILVIMAAVVFADKILAFLKKNIACRFALDESDDKLNLPLLLLSGAGLTVLCGIFLPSNVISSSPEEFSFVGKTASPFAYIWSSLFVFSGFFIFWPVAILKMFDVRVRRIESRFLVITFFIALANAFIFKFDYRDVGITFVIQPEVLSTISVFNYIGPAVFIALILTVLYFAEKFRVLSYVGFFMLAICFAEIGMSVPKLNYIQSKYKVIAGKRNNQEMQKVALEPLYHFSKTGKNVVYIFMDRWIGQIFDEITSLYPEYKDIFSGFTFYPNTVSFSNRTSSGLPAMIGGYEYTPFEINKRIDSVIIDKQMESSLVMPSIFSEGGFEVTTTDSWASPCIWREGYKPSFVPEYKPYELKGQFSDEFKKELGIDVGGDTDRIIHAEIKNFSIIQILFPVCRKFFERRFKIIGNVDKFYNTLVTEYIDNISTLYYLNRLTDFNAKKDQFIYMGNDVNHEPVFVESDLTTPCLRTHPLWETVKTPEGIALTYLHVGLATCAQLSKWFDYLRQNGVYDNTRIVIVSDHGFPLLEKEHKIFSNPQLPLFCNSVLLVKDFNSTGSLKKDNTFMTNADAFFFAKEGLGLSEKNPYTGKTFVQNKKNGVNVCLLPLRNVVGEYIVEHSQFEIIKDEAWHVSDNIFEEKNWIPLKEWEKQKGE